MLPMQVLLLSRCDLCFASDFFPCTVPVMCTHQHNWWDRVLIRCVALLQTYITASQYMRFKFGVMKYDLYIFILFLVFLISEVYLHVTHVVVDSEYDRDLLLDICWGDGSCCINI